MAGKCGCVGAAGEETGALIGAEGRDSRLITISQQFTCLHFCQLRGGYYVRVEMICLHLSLRCRLRFKTLFVPVCLIITLYAELLLHGM